MYPISLAAYLHIVSSKIPEKPSGHPFTLPLSPNAKSLPVVGADVGDSVGAVGADVGDPVGATTAALIAVLAMTLVPMAAVMPLTPFMAVVICSARVDLAAVTAAAAAVAAASSATWTTARTWAPVEVESESDLWV